MDLGRLVKFPAFGGTTLSPAWSSDGTHLAFSSSRTGDPEIYVCDQNGNDLKRLTDVSWPRRLARSGIPRPTRRSPGSAGAPACRRSTPWTPTEPTCSELTDQGYAVSPSWSPNGQFLAFAWIRHYGPGAPGASDIYIMDVASRQWVQLTHDGGRNDFPSWSPDGRHIVYQSTRSGTEQIWTMLADGSQQTQLTFTGSNSQPNWSWK